MSTYQGRTTITNECTESITMSVIDKKRIHLLQNTPLRACEGSILVPQCCWKAFVVKNIFFFFNN